jgi:hypothetical protein
LQIQGSGGVLDQPNPPHRHGYQHKTSLLDWRRQQELVRHAQEQQLQRLVRQGSGACGAVPGSFLAMMQDSGDGDSTPPPPPPPPAPVQWPPQQQQGGGGGLRQGSGSHLAYPVSAAAAAAAAAGAAAAAAAAAAGGAEGGSGDEEYDPLAGYDPTASPVDARAHDSAGARGPAGAGAEARAGAQQGRGGRVRPQPAGETTTQEDDSWDDDVWDEFDEMPMLEEDAWRVRLQAVQRPQVGQQQQGKAWAVGRGAAAGAGGRAAAAPVRPPAQEEPEVIDLISDSD